MPGTPISITLYGPEDEEKKTYTRSIVPWGILKKALALSRAIGSDAKEINEESLDTIAQFVVDVFGGQFSVQDLNDGAELGEIVAVLRNIVARAGALVKANPTPPPNPTAAKPSR